MTRFKTLCAFVTISCAIWTGSASAQTISQPVDETTTLSAGIGQSFTATLTGELRAISVSAGSGANRTLNLYAGDVGSGTTTGLGTPAYSQLVTLLFTPVGAPLQRINLTTPFPITAGAKYSFVFSAGTEMRHSLSDQYPGGRLLFEYADPRPGFDLAFEVFEAVVPAPAASVSSIPSSSEWSLIGASLLVLAGRSAGAQRRR